MPLLVFSATRFPGLLSFLSSKHLHTNCSFTNEESRGIVKANKNNEDVRYLLFPEPKHAGESGSLPGFLKQIRTNDGFSRYGSTAV